MSDESRDGSEANDAADDAGEYPVAPLPTSFQDATSPAYKPAEMPNVAEAYEVGPEVDDAGFAIGATSWREASAGVQRSIDEFDVEPPPVLPKNSGFARWLVRVQAERQLAKSRDARIATLQDPARFTLRGLFFMITFASVVMAMGSRLPRPVFAGVCGLAAFVTLLLSRYFHGGGAFAKLAWYMLMTIYLVVAVLAALGL